MPKFKFTTLSPANPAKVANSIKYQVVTPDKLSLKFAKINGNNKEQEHTLATFRNPLADENDRHTRGLAGLATLAGGRIAKNPTPPPDLSRILPQNQKEYRRLWYGAWNLVDFIDSDTASYEDRIKKMPELTQLNDRMRVIENMPWPRPYYQKLLVSFSPWVRMEEKKTWTPDTCPARCKDIGKCYGTAFFDHKPGKAFNCQGTACPWSKTPSKVT